jgi:hypothetical protein
MAKRSVKKRRQAAPPQSPAPERASRRPFWLGMLVAAAVLVPLAIVGVVVASNGGSDPQADEEAAVRKSIETEAEELRRKTQVRDKEQVKDLTDRMRGTVDALGPVLSGINRTLPPGTEKVGRLARPAAVAKWRRAVAKEDEYFADTVSGETGTNVARGGFSASLDTLANAVDTYALALDQPGARARLLESVRRQRDLAIRTWSVAATQLDAINIATGYGHQHVYLGGAEEAGGFGADPAPEGSGAEDHTGE